MQLLRTKITVEYEFRKLVFKNQFILCHILMILAQVITP
jgi:hypothetical protein